MILRYKHGVPTSGELQTSKDPKSNDYYLVSLIPLIHTTTPEDAKSFKNIEEAEKYIGDGFSDYVANTFGQTYKVPSFINHNS